MYKMMCSDQRIVKIVAGQMRGGHFKNDNIISVHCGRSDHPRFGRPLCVSITKAMRVNHCLMYVYVVFLGTDQLYSIILCTFSPFLNGL
jgi:hypothetical protein